MSTQEPKDKHRVVNSSYVRKDFYLSPPVKGAPVEAWEAWQKADDLLAANAKRKHTKSLKHEEVPEFLQPKVLSKVGGVYRQSAMVGFIGDGDTARVEAAVDAEQGKVLALNSFRHGGRGQQTASRSGSAKRAARRAAKEARRKNTRH